MLKQVFIFITAFAMFIIAMSALEALVPLLLGIDGLEAEAMQDPERIKNFMERQPAAYYVGLVLVHFIGALVGGLVLGFGGLPRWSAYLLVACCMAIGSAFMLPGHPTWYRILDLINYIPGVLLGYEWVSHARKLVAKKAGKVGEA
jgi:hypothetical protein